MNIIENARRMRAAMVGAAASLDDASASANPHLFIQLKGTGAQIKSGTRINWNGVIKKAKIDLIDLASNNPDNAPNLWSDISYRYGYRIIPKSNTSFFSFAKDEYGWWDGAVYISLKDNNTSNPSSNSDEWTKI